MSYNIEGNIDFYTMLHSIDDTSNNIINYNDFCLISNTKLTSTAIKLSCGHSFNYEPIYREVIKQKLNRSTLEVVKLAEYQIKCPYCRNIQEKLLPFLKIPGTKRLYGVNHPLHKTMCNNLCEYQFKSGKNKGKTCDSICFFEYCNTHQTLVEKNKMKPKTDNSKTSKTKTVKQLREMAKELDVKKYYKMKKIELMEAIHSIQNSNIVIDPK